MLRQALLAVLNRMVMPSKPPSLKPRVKRSAWASSQRGSRQARGYGRAHEQMRERVLSEEPLCRRCDAHGRIAVTAIADHVIPKAEGGSDERSNYQGLCGACHREKTQAEAKRARRRIL